jgi:hypothetical protein
MLTIQQVKRYCIARYPKEVYSRKGRSLPKTLLERGAVSLVMLALLEFCDHGGLRAGVGMMGPPPALPELLTENEARQIIEHVFADNGVVLDNDVRLVLHYGQNDSAELILDGFNDSLEVGYEYAYSREDTVFTANVREALEDSLANNDAPYIKVLNSIHKYPGQQEFLEHAVEQFIDTLQAHGVI